MGVSNNGLLPLTNGAQPNGQASGYSQVSPMFGMYYNASQAPSGNSVLGYNYGAGNMMPGGVTGGSGAVPTAPPTGGSMALGGSSSGSSTNTPGAPATGTGSTSTPGTGYNAFSATSNYRAPSTGAAYRPVSTPAYQAANGVAAHPLMQAPPVAAQSPAQPKYNQQGPLASPGVHPIPGQTVANSSGQMQGSTRTTGAQPMYGNPNPPPPTIVSQGGDGSAPYGNPPAPKPPVYTNPGGNPPGFGKPVTEHPTPPGKPAPKPPVKKPAPPPSALDKWLAGDTTYQQQLAEYNQEQQAYNQNYTNSKDQIDQNFNATQRSMNNQANLDRMNQQYDFAGRGVLSSGAYAQALDQYNTQFNNNLGNLTQGEQQQLTANQTNLNNFLRQLTIQRDAAKQDAIARRAAQLGITG